MVVPQPTSHDLKPADKELSSIGHFKVRDGVLFAGTHVLLDMWEARRLDDLDHLKAAIETSAEAAQATLLHIHLHHFSPQGGVSGVALLAESHISVHTWPERSFAAFDIFMCGDAEPLKAAEALRRELGPGRIELTEQRRGILKNLSFDK